MSNVHTWEIKDGEVITTYRANNVKPFNVHDSDIFEFISRGWSLKALVFNNYLIEVENS